MSFGSLKMTIQSASLQLLLPARWWTLLTQRPPWGKHNSWFKVKLKDDNADSPSVGLVPASYLTPYPVLRAVRASFDYTPARLDTGELENEEEMEIAEGEQLDLLIDEGDWSLVAKKDGQSVGFVPANYLEVCYSHVL